MHIVYQTIVVFFYLYLTNKITQTHTHTHLVFYMGLKENKRDFYSVVDAEVFKLHFP